MPGLYISAPDATLAPLLHAYDLPVAAFTGDASAIPVGLPHAAFLRRASVAALLGQPIAADALRLHLQAASPLTANVLRRHVMLRLSLTPYLRPGRAVTTVPGGLLVGDALLILPVATDDTVDAPLPPGVWTELSGACHTGRLKCMRGYNETPLLVRMNTLLPVGMNGGSPAQRASTDADRLTLHWFQPEQEAACTLADGTRYHVRRTGEGVTLHTDAEKPVHLIVHEDGAERLIQ